MSITDYVIDILLILFILRQVRPHELTLRTLALPLTLIVVAGFGFAYYAYHSGAGAVARFSASHHITGAGVWTTALVVMAFGQVLARLAVLQVRRVRDGRLVKIRPASRTARA